MSWVGAGAGWFVALGLTAMLESLEAPHHHVPPVAEIALLVASTVLGGLIGAASGLAFEWRKTRDSGKRGGAPS